MFRKKLSVVALIIILCQISVKAQEAASTFILPNVEVDTAAYPALRILRQLHEHEKEDRYATVQSFDVFAEGDYMFQFKASKFLTGYMRGTMSVLGYPRMAKLMLGNDSLSHKFHVYKQYRKGKLKDVETVLDSANIELSKKQYDLLKRSNFDIDDLLMPQFRNPKQAWGSKHYDRYEWRLVDTTNMDGHRVDVLEYRSFPQKKLKDRMRGEVIGRILVIEDYWRIVGVDVRNMSNNSIFQVKMHQIAPGVFIPYEMREVQDASMTTDYLLQLMEISPDSLSDKKRQKLDKVMGAAGFIVEDKYSFRSHVSNVVVRKTK